MYCIDTSAVLDGWVRYYPPDLFPPLWEEFEQMGQKGLLFAPDEVLEELGKKQDDAHAWAKKQAGMFVELTDDVQDATARILEVYPKLVKAEQARTSADPFVIALAQVRGLVVVTGENQGSENRPKIPYVCAQLGVKCTNLVGLMRAEGLRFARQ